MRWIDGYRPWAHAEGGWNKNATATTAYTITSNAPSYQLLRTSETTAATTAVAKANDASSKISKSRVMTFAVRRDTNTRIGATNNATCVVDVVATATLNSILFLQAMRTALPCSAAFPTIATMMTPTKSSVSPRLCRAVSREPTRISLSTATSTVETTRTLRANRFSQRGFSTTSLTGLKMSRCVRREKNKPNTYARSRIPAMPRLISSSVTPDRMPVESTYRAGMTSPITATTSIVIWIPDASREKCCTLYFTPPASMLRPRTNRRFPTIEPVSDAFTTSVRPRDSAKIAMMSSVAFPNVALSRPPTPGPACLPSSSVASPRNHASGTMAIPAAAKTMTPGPRIRSRIQLTGTKRPSRRAQV